MEGYGLGSIRDDHQHDAALEATAKNTDQFGEGLTDDFERGGRWIHPNPYRNLL
jgi:hypothetical protein